MPKAFTIAGMVVAGIVFLLFALDAVVGFPFYKASLVMDLGFIVASLILAYMSWSTYRDLK
jgi:hypothetical protein